MQASKANRDRAIAILEQKGDERSLLQLQIIKENRSDKWVFKHYMTDRQGTVDQYQDAHEAAQFLEGRLSLEDLIPDAEKYSVAPTAGNGKKMPDGYTRISSVVLSELLKTVQRLEAKVDAFTKLLDERAKDPIKDLCTNDDMMTQKEAAAYIGCSKPTMHKWTKLGVIAGYKTGPKVYYSRAEIDANVTISNYRKIKGLCVSQ